MNCNFFYPNEADYICNARDKDEKCIRIFSRNRRDCVEDMGILGRTLDRTEMDGRVCVGLKWLRIGYCAFVNLMIDHLVLYQTGDFFISFSRRVQPHRAGYFLSVKKYIPRRND